MTLYCRFFPRTPGGSALWADPSPAGDLIRASFFGEPVSAGVAGTLSAIRSGSTTASGEAAIGISAELVAEDQSDTISGTTTTAISAAAGSVFELSPTFSATATIVVSGSLDAVDQEEVFSAVGEVWASGSISAERVDESTASATLGVRISANFSSLDYPDTFSASAHSEISAAANAQTVVLGDAVGALKLAVSGPLAANVALAGSLSAAVEVSITAAASAAAETTSESQAEVKVLVFSELSAINDQPDIFSGLGRSKPPKPVVFVSGGWRPIPQSVANTKSFSVTARTSSVVETASIRQKPTTVADRPSFAAQGRRR